LPEVPDVNVTQDALDEAVQAQPAPVFTVTVADPPSGPMECVAGAIE
jgi:hypothetical protein